MRSHQACKTPRGQAKPPSTRPWMLPSLARASARNVAAIVDDLDIAAPSPVAGDARNRAADARPEEWMTSFTLVRSRSLVKTWGRLACDGAR